MGSVLGLCQWLARRLPSITINVNGKPYLTRYYFLGRDRKWFNLYLHHFHSSDQKHELHSHPWRWAFSIIVLGGYYEERIDNHASYGNTITHRRVGPRAVNFITNRDFHRVDLINEKMGCWSLFITGPRIKGWGFLNKHTGEFRDWTTHPEAIP